MRLKINICPQNYHTATYPITKLMADRGSAMPPSAIPVEIHVTSDDDDSDNGVKATKQAKRDTIETPGFRAINEEEEEEEDEDDNEDDDDDDDDEEDDDEEGEDSEAAITISDDEPTSPRAATKRKAAKKAKKQLYKVSECMPKMAKITELNKKKLFADTRNRVNGDQDNQRNHFHPHGEGQESVRRQQRL